MRFICRIDDTLWFVYIFTSCCRSSWNKDMLGSLTFYLVFSYVWLFGFVLYGVRKSQQPHSPFRFLVLIMIRDRFCSQAYPLLMQSQPSKWPLINLVRLSFNSQHFTQWRCANYDWLYPKFLLFWVTSLFRKMLIHILQKYLTFFLT